MSEPVKIVVAIEGGCVSSVETFGVPVEVLVVDYDNQDTTDPDVKPVPQDNAPGMMAAVFKLSAVALHGADLARVEALWDNAREG